MTPKEKLTALIDQFAQGNQQAFAQLIGVPRSSVATWMHRGKITANGREAILDALPQVSREWLQDAADPAEDQQMMNPAPDSVAIPLSQLTPLYGENVATCGVAEQFERPELATAHIHVPGFRAKAALPASGDSMVPTIHDGDICLIGEEVSLLNVNPRRVYLIVTRQGHCMFKRIFDEGRTAQKIFALSDNPDYYPHAEPFLKADILHVYPLKYVLHEV